MMLKNFVDKIKRATAPPPEMMTPDERHRAVEGSNSAELAAQLLIAPTALMQLTMEEATIVVSYMSPRKIARGTTFIKEGDKTDTAYMVLLLEGEVTVESIAVSRSEPVTVTVLGPGSLIGEMGLVDGEARLASCTATTTVRCANLTRAALEKLTADDPATAAKLILAVALRIAVRLRDTAEKLKLYSQLVLAMQQEIDHMMPTPIELIGRSKPPK
jgi:CRP/FNR family transcriptional regulator, cyclic AMP receptor protein